MSKLAALLVLLLAAPAFADEAPAADLVPSKLVFGRILLGVGSAAAVAADVTGGWWITSGIGCGLGDGGNCPSNDGMRNAAIGLALVSSVTMAIGMPLVVAGSHDKRNKVPVRFGLAPTGGSSGGGVQASLAVHF